jgi:DNA-binding transcriptional regulator LsrR (DeoR family)
VPVTAARAAEIRAAYDSGLTARACAAQFGVNQETVARAVRAAGGTMRKSGPRPGSAPAAPQARELARLYCQKGWGIQRCANRFHISYALARQALVDQGVTIRSRGGAHR